MPQLVKSVMKVWAVCATFWWVIVPLFVVAAAHRACWWKAPFEVDAVLTVFLWTVCVSEVPDGFWTRRRPEALAGDAVLYCTTALVSVGPLPHYGLSCDFFCCQRGEARPGVVLPLYLGMTMLSGILYII